MSERRYQVFLSSTYTDLTLERERVLRELAGHDYIASGMEYFPAMDEEQFEYIKTVIDEADYYVIITAGRYGRWLLTTSAIVRKSIDTRWRDQYP